MPARPGSMRRHCTRNWWLFSPQTRELQLDEKWSFVFKKHKRCSKEELEQEKVGDCWDHIAFDPEHRLVLGAVFGRRSQGHIQKLVQKIKRQLQGRIPTLISADGYLGYADVFKTV